MDDAIEKELEIASRVLDSLTGDDIDAIDIKSVEQDEAPFLARIVSKLSPMVGNLMEQRIVSILNQNASPGYVWERQDPGFPDAVLREATTGKIVAGYEIKAWFVLSTEITGRFRESVNLLSGKNVNVVLVAWCLSNMIFGQPKVLGVLTVSGEELALSRDMHYHNPPEYLTIEPNDTSDRTSNLQQSNVNGYRLQERESTPELLIAARNRQYLQIPSHDPLVQEEALKLMNELAYRLDTNFAKIDRVKNEHVEEFKQQILQSTYLDRRISDWKTIFQNLSNASEKKRLTAESMIQSLYSDMLTEEPRTAIRLDSEDAH